MTAAQANPAASVAVIGGGPAGLMACEALAAQGLQVDLYDAMPSVGRKFLLAGIGGLNLTHSEPMPGFMSRYGAREVSVTPWLQAMGPDQLREWAQGLGIETFVGTSGRVFPTDMKAAPLLRAWLHRLRVAGVRFHMRHRWLGWDGGGEEDGALVTTGHALRFDTPSGELKVQAATVVLALGGGSWPRLGSDGAWVEWLQQQGAEVAPLRPANCGFDVGWSEHFRTRFAGQPIKPVSISYTDASGHAERRQGEFVITETGIEGSLVYAFSAALRDRIEADGAVQIELDLLPSHELDRVVSEVARPRGPRSLSTHLKSRLGLQGAKASLLWEVLTKEQQDDPAALARAIKSLPLKLVATRPLAEAISTAGGVTFETMTDGSMLRSRAGVFCAGEMVDWEAPTGCYLLTACMASGLHAGRAAGQWLSQGSPPG
ncbi:TIGR03862 family flavoprotein [soil metagenome]